MIPTLALRGPPRGRRPAGKAEPVASKVTEPGETEHVERGAVPEQSRVDAGPLGRKPDGTVVVSNAAGLARSQTSRSDVCATRQVNVMLADAGIHLRHLSEGSWIPAPRFHGDKLRGNDDGMRGSDGTPARLAASPMERSSSTTQRAWRVRRHQETMSAPPAYCQVGTSTDK